jgi:hypothetical protein
VNEQVKRNKNRFPGDFMFQLTPEAKLEVVAKCDHLTEHGALMAAGILN